MVLQISLYYENCVPVKKSSFAIQNGCNYFKDHLQLFVYYIYLYIQTAIFQQLARSIQQELIYYPVTTIQPASNYCIITIQLFIYLYFYISVICNLPVNQLLAKLVTLCKTFQTSQTCQLNIYLHSSLAIYNRLISDRLLLWFKKIPFVVL